MSKTKILINLLLKGTEKKFSILFIFIITLSVIELGFLALLPKVIATLLKSTEF